MEPAKFIGRSKEQVEEFLSERILPLLDATRNVLGEKQELTV